MLVTSSFSSFAITLGRKALWTPTLTPVSRTIRAIGAVTSEVAASVEASNYGADDAASVARPACSATVRYRRTDSAPVRNGCGSPGFLAASACIFAIELS